MAVKEKIDAILDSSVKLMLPAALILLSWQSFQIVETDKTQEVVLKELATIKMEIIDIKLEIKHIESRIDILPAQLNIGDRWTGKMQQIWGDSIVERIDRIENVYHRHLWDIR